MTEWITVSTNIEHWKNSMYAFVVFFPNASSEPQLKISLFWVIFREQPTGIINTYEKTNE